MFSNFKRKIKSNHRNTPKHRKDFHQKYAYSLSLTFNLIYLSFNFYGSQNSMKYEFARKPSKSITSIRSNGDSEKQDNQDQANTVTGRLMEITTFNSDAMKTDGLNSVISPKVNEPNTWRVKQFPDRQRME